MTHIVTFAPISKAKAIRIERAVKRVDSSVFVVRGSLGYPDETQYRPGHVSTNEFITNSVRARVAEVALVVE